MSVSGLLVDACCMSPRRRLRANRELWQARQISRELRHDEASHLAGVLALNGNCARPDTGWSDAEMRFARAANAEEAASAAAMALVLCDECPVRFECHRWATVDRYTGLAAGSAWVRGRDFEPTSTINQPPQRGRAA